MNDVMDLEKEVAERLLLRVMAPIRKVMSENKPEKDEDWDDAKEVVFTLAQVRELDRDLGALGLTLANRYREQADFRTALAVSATENVRLFGSVSALSELLEAQKKQSSDLANALAKERNVSDKLKVVTGFKSTPR